jgi:predicted TIM-barrel fold metal-dependent hydrolase
MTEQWDSIDRYVLITSDAHAGADLLDYKPYLDRRWHDEFDRWAAAYENPWPNLGNQSAKRNWDNEFRMAELDADGIAGEVIFPNTTPPFQPGLVILRLLLPRTFESFERQWAGMQAHNRWLLDFCSLEPVRRRGLAQILPHDVGAAVETIEWAAGTDGLISGVMMPVIPPNHPVDPLFHRRYDPIWQACQETGISFNVHGGSGSPEFPMDQPGAAAVMFMEFALWPRRTVPHLALGGVFDRYPDLKVVVTENYSLLSAVQDRQLMDSVHASITGSTDNHSTIFFGGEDMRGLKMKPSEYLDRCVYYGTTGTGLLAPGETPARYEVGVDHIMWGNDYPHEEGTAPESTLALRWTFADLPVDETRKMVGGNAAEVYGFDLDALVPIAKRVGPTVEEVHTALPGSHADTLQGAHGGDAGARPFEGGRVYAA